MINLVNFEKIVYLICSTEQILSLKVFPHLLQQF